MDYRSLYPPGAREVNGISWRMRVSWHPEALAPWLQDYGFGDLRTTLLQQLERVCPVLLLEPDPQIPPLKGVLLLLVNYLWFMGASAIKSISSSLVYHYKTGHSNCLVTSPLSLPMRDLVSPLEELFAHMTVKNPRGTLHLNEISFSVAICLDVLLLLAFFLQLYHGFSTQEVTFYLKHSWWRWSGGKASVGRLIWLPMLSTICFLLFNYLCIIYKLTEPPCEIHGEKPFCT